ncbi:MAG TPA: T9SS type A sorting domain-containing protein [bacterium]|nr:T9SS type A sorting domain-containing protein [bacterium]HPN45606.1 T9SS type A sorting domain-containing protein [bacterium]
MAGKRINRRTFIKKSGLASGAALAAGLLPIRSVKSNPFRDDVSHIFMARNNGPAQNMENVISQMGGISTIIQNNDIVVIKTNAQWWNQGSPNLAAMKKFIELILTSPGFSGEVIICDNNHRADPLSKGAWGTTFEINSDVANVHNLVDLIDLLQSQGHANVTSYCWNDVKNYGGTRVTGPEEGDGYVYLTDIIYDNGASGDDHRQTIMSYPVFTSSYSGITIDLKNGAWKNGQYTGQPVKLIVFSALCYHSNYAGVTSALKNHFGIVDLSGGSNPATDGIITGGFYNFHAFAYNWDDPGPAPGVMGGAVGTFLQQVRCADLFITTAEWVGWADRRTVSVAEHTEVILASADPVALDYYASKYVLYPVASEKNENIAPYMNPDLAELPLRQYLNTCHALGIGNLAEEKIIVHTEPTPVHLVVFYARIVDNQVELGWEVEQAEGFFGYEIQRSTDNNEFIKIGFVEFNQRYRTYSFTDQESDYGKIKYRLKLLDNDGTLNFSETITLVIKQENTFHLYQNYPNPFNSRTVIQFSLSHYSHVTLAIFDVTGQRVKTLLEDYRYPGFYSLNWDGTNDYNSKVAAGFYVYQLKTEMQYLTRKMFLVN